MKQLKGKLRFFSMWQPITLFTDNGEIDLRDHYEKLFSDLKGNGVIQKDGMHNITIQRDDDSKWIFDYFQDNDTFRCAMENKESGGWSNTGLYLANKLQDINGRQVIVDIGYDGISIMADPQEKVFQLNYTHGNCCRIPADKVNEICQPGTGNTCIFLTAGGKGFECLKFSGPSARHLLERHSNGKMNASRIGNCEVVGRIDEEEEKNQINNSINQQTL